MTNIENINAYVEQKYPQDDKNYTYEDLRTAFMEGLNWNTSHPDANGYCNARIWHYVSDLVEKNGEMVPDLPDYNKVCFVKFSDDTGGISTRSKTSKAKNQWVTAYRDDIVAWSYYIMK